MLAGLDSLICWCWSGAGVTTGADTVDTMDPGDSMLARLDQTVEVGPLFTLGATGDPLPPSTGTPPTGPPPLDRRLLAVLVVPEPPWPATHSHVTSRHNAQSRKCLPVHVSPDLCP